MYQSQTPGKSRYHKKKSQDVMLQVYRIESVFQIWQCRALLKQTLQRKNVKFSFGTIRTLFVLVGSGKIH